MYKVLAECTKAAESVRYIAYDIESFFVAITEVSTVAGYLAGYLAIRRTIRALPILAMPWAATCAERRRLPA